MIAEDLYENLLRQRVHIMDAAKHSNRLLFVDTDALTTLFYSGFLLGGTEAEELCHQLASAIHRMTPWDLVLFLEPDVAFVQDGTRNETIADDRQTYSRQLLDIFREHGLPIHHVSGDYLKRFETAKALIETELGITTCF